jgi:hypothetical protein
MGRIKHLHLTMIGLRGLITPEAQTINMHQKESNMNGKRP